jgi:sacsin
VRSSSEVAASTNCSLDQLCRYCLQGLDDDTSGDLLAGLPLLPLADGSLGTFGRPSEAPIFVATVEEYRLFASKVPQLFLEQGLMVSEETQKRLGGLAARGATTLRLLDNANVASILLPRVLPPEWKGQLEIEWRPPVKAGGLGAGLVEQSAVVSGNPEGGPGNHPSTEWLAGLWKWLAAKNMQGLEGFSEWPLLPTSNGMLCSLLEIDPVPAAESVVSSNRSSKPHSIVIRGEVLSEGVSSLLLTAGCQLLRSDLVDAHPVPNKFVHSSTATGVLGALAEAARRKGLPLKELIKEATHTQRQEMRAFLCQSKWFTVVNSISAPPASNQASQQRTHSNSGEGIPLSPSHLRILASLPIFEAYTGVEAITASVNRLFVDLTSKQRFFPPPGVPESLLSENFLRSENENERTLLSKHLGVGSLGRAAFYLDHVFGRSETLATEVGRRAMLTVLSDLPSLSVENPGFMTKLTRLAFVPTGAGTLAAPVDLYDPGVNELHTLLDRGAFFPIEEFQRPQVLEVLRGLGLRRSMGRRGLLDSARSVEMKSGSDMGEAVKRGRALLRHLDDLELESEQHVAPDHESAPAEGAPDEGLRVNRPSVGEVKLDKLPNPRVLDSETSSPPAPNDLEEDAFWSQLAGVSWCPVLVEAPDVRLPWRILGGPLAPSRFVRPKEDAWLVSSGLRLLDGEVKSVNLKSKLGWGNPPGANFLAGQLLELGRKYPQVEEEGLTEVLRGAVLALYSALEGVVRSEEFEVVKASLEGASCVWVSNGFVPARSIAFESPANFHPYLYAIPSELASYRRLLEALEVRERFAVRDYAQLLFRMARDSKGEPLPSEQLNVVFRVLDVLADDPGLVRGTSVLLPDKAGRLCRADDLVFNDAAWLADDGETGPRLVHPDVQNEVAEKLGARSLRYLFLVDQEMTSDVPCPGLGLTRMVNDDRKLVLFDLLEVADVAGARRVEVLVDGREHPRQSLLQPNLAPFQGPAIVVRMDGPPLTVPELSALFAPPPAKLRGRSCSYGSGLLSCFGVTDLPFIASGGLLYMFDLHGEILTASLNGSTGRRQVPTGKAYSLDGTDLVTRFSDQLLPLGLTANSYPGLQVTPMEGTVIRLPLRGASEENPGGLAGVREALDFFREHLASSLLFLRAVEEVAVKVHVPGGEAATELMRCSILPQQVDLRQVGCLPFPFHPFNRLLGLWAMVSRGAFCGCRVTSNLLTPKLGTRGVGGLRRGSHQPQCAACIETVIKRPMYLSDDFVSMHSSADMP